MKIVLTGGGSGGHFYPLIAVARSIFKIAEVERVAKVEIILVSNDPMDKTLLDKEGIKFIKIPAGKIRRYFSLKNISDGIKTLSGVISSFFILYKIMPDVIFGKGGYPAFPVLFAAKIFKIPVIIHETDSIPGVVNSWSGKWAKKIAVSFLETTKFFDAKKVIVTGNPVRSQIVGGNLSEALLHFKLEEGVPTILVLGGSQGSAKINETILDVLSELVLTYQIIHQTGEKNFSDVKGRSNVILEKQPLKHRYHPFAFLNEGDLKNAGRVASLAVSRSGGSIFEIAMWGIPSILIPLPNAGRNHQRENAYNYAAKGACEVVEETNLKPHILLSQINKILNDKEKIQKMSGAAKSFSRPDAADAIAREVLKLGIHD